MPLRIILSFKCPTDQKYEASFAIKVPKKFWDKASQFLLDWFVEFYNKKFPERPLDAMDLTLYDQDGKVYPSEAVIQECFSHKQEVVLRSKKEMVAIATSEKASEGKDEKADTQIKEETIPALTGKAMTLNSMVDMENPDEFSKAEERTEKQYRTLKSNHGLQAEVTLKAAFKVTDLCIAQYKLDRVDEVLAEIEGACSADKSSDKYTKFIQMKAFCRWKQSRFKEALKLFEEMKNRVGLSSKLLENMGHTYNSLGDYDKAQESFQKALDLVDVELKLNPEADSHKGGLYMGLGLVKKRRGKVEEGLVDLKRSLKWYQDTTGPKPHSLCAKAHMSVAHAYEDLKDWKKAATHMELAVDIFQKTCGNSSPLTGNAQGALGKVLLELNKPEAAWEALVAAFENEVKHDSLKVFTLFEHATLIYKLCTSKTTSPKDVQVLVPSLMLLDENIGQQMVSGLVKRDGNVGALYKSMAEVAIVAQHYRMSNTFLCKALTHFGEEKSFDCGSLITECRNVLVLVNDLIRKGIGN
mmetsp:Transcript_8880/g.14091  ORF Transcript_8880/g.14091 Transcript_8880/m.14091 type:complete len:526 (+) Transcript_8880:53-1630(+)